MFDWWWHEDAHRATPARTVELIEAMNRVWMHFWGKPRAGIPVAVRDLMSTCRLDRQVELSGALRRWLQPGVEGQGEAELILAWANLGALVEGSLKFFLVVYVNDYQRHTSEVFGPKHADDDPDALMLFRLQKFYRDKVWLPTDCWWDAWVDAVRKRRNAIHAFRDRDLGTHDEFIAALRGYCLLLRWIEGRLPTPE